MSDRAEWALHFVAGAAMAAIELWVTGSAVLALFWPTLLSWARESEQARASRERLSLRIGRRVRPGDVREWSAHKWSEFLSFTAGACAAVGVYALS